MYHWSVLILCLWALLGWSAVAWSQAPTMVKYISPQGNVVLYKPAAWQVREEGNPQACDVQVSDPQGKVLVKQSLRINPQGHNLLAMLRALCQPVQANCPDFQFEEGWLAPQGNRAVFAFTYTHPQLGPREGRAWLTAEGQLGLISLAETPAGQFGPYKPLLLSILANIKIMKNGFLPVGTGTGSQVMPLRPYRLGDGSATFALPPHWSYQDLGRTHFLAKDAARQSSFMVLAVEVLSPRLGVQVPNVPVLPFLPPDQALATLASRQGLLANLQFVERWPRPDLSQLISQVYTAGPVQAAELLYTFTDQGRRCQGYTLGICFGSRLDTGWRFWHLTFTAPAEQFSAMVPTFLAMAQAYHIDDAYAQQYIANGLRRLRELQAQTAAVVSRTRQEISAMMQAAYDERQRSQDYIDYQRTNYIRGQQDWISHLEGGTIYHTDSWGTKNTYTGQTWEGAPFNYFHYQGENPRYRESLTPIDNRRLYDQVFGK